MTSTPSNNACIGVTKNDENDAIGLFEKPAPDERMTAEVYDESSTSQEEAHHTVSTSAYYQLEDYCYDGTQDWLEADTEMDTGGDF